jgi:hypothetical protein
VKQLVSRGERARQAGEADRIIRIIPG